MIRLNPPFPNNRINALGWVGSDLYLSYRRNKYQNDFIIISNFELIVPLNLAMCRLVFYKKNLRICYNYGRNDNGIDYVYTPDTKQIVSECRFTELKRQSIFNKYREHDVKYDCKPAHNWYPRAKKDNTFKKHNRRWCFGEKVYVATTSPDQLTMTVFTENNIFIVDVGE